LMQKRIKEDKDDDADPLNNTDEDTVETLSDDHTSKNDTFSAKELLKKYRIQEVIKPRQIILIQVVKEERGNKGAALTTFISLAGRYSVLMPNSNKKSAYGISRKIYKRDDRQRLRKILKDLEIPDNMTLIVRTAGLSAIPEQIKQDQKYLAELWNTVKKETFDSEVPSLIYEEGGLIKRVLRDMLQDDVSDVIIDGEDGYREAKDFYKDITGKTVRFIKLHKGKTPLFVQYKVEDQLETIHSAEVTLPSGGSIVINQTEALVAIDVNSGRATKERNIEDTAVKTNLEAGAEIARQMRLRDLAGLIVVDFIDMEEEKNRQRVEHKMRDTMRPDRAKIQIRKISSLGLMELSRQRMRPSFLESSYLKCPHCRGLGVMPSVQTASVLMLRQIEKRLIQEKVDRLIISVPPEVAIYILNQKREDISLLEKKYETTLVIAGDESIISIHEFTVDKMSQNTTTGRYLLDNRPIGKSRKETERRRTIMDLIKKSPRQNVSERKEPSFWEKLFSDTKKETEKPKQNQNNQNHRNNRNNKNYNRNNNHRKKYYHKKKNT
ncbi:MAG: Rne/Rng family ribonuclease, partial [Alphaproteobacteria bacterium]